MTDISQKIFKKIEEAHIAPKPRWQFLAKNYSIWFLFGLCLFFVSVSFGTIIHLFNDNDYGRVGRPEPRFIGHILTNLPYLWLVFLLIFFVLAYFNFYHTKEGYRRRVGIFFLATFILILIIGVSSYYIGFAKKTDNFLSERMPMYNHMVSHQSRFWMNPERGLLAGEIIKLRNTNDFDFKDLNDKVWQAQGENIIWRDAIKPEVGLRARLIGEQEENKIFKVEEIMPFKPEHKGCRRERCGMMERE